ncbi:MAG: DUF11 domain-containing protein [Verrucomicrobia bacterium]|nr:DUF11 domain-containing protein [Verrucomicrobiota bacterium]
MNPNGTWNLFIRDDYTGDSGVLANGYILNIYSVTTNCTTCAVAASADLAIGQTVVPASTYTNNNVVFTLAVTNLGSGSASAVVVSNTLPVGLNYVSATPAATSTNGRIYGFTLGTLGNAAVSNITLTARTAANGNYTNSATVSSGTSDPVGANNTAAAVVTVTTPPVISGVTFSNNAVSLGWTGLPGITYRIQYKTNLTQAAWLDFTGDIVPGGAPFSTNLPVAGGQRYYRIMALP